MLQTETEGVAHFVQRMYSRCGIAGEVVRKERPAGPVFEFHVQEPEAVRKALELFGHTGREPALRIRPDSFRCQNCVSCFVSTAFLCCGTVNDPEKGYNIEFLSTRYQLSQQLEAILAEHEFHPHRALRKGASTVYVKAGDHIEDLLTFMGAGNAAMRIMEAAHVQRHAQQDQPPVQLRDRQPRQERAGGRAGAPGHRKRSNRPAPLDTLPAPLPDTARLRLAYPDLPLSKLGQKFDPPVSKAGLCHRFKRIQQAARRLQENQSAAAAPGKEHHG